jgi:hypothetical protein
MATKKRPKTKRPVEYIGLDGEGQDDAFACHHYVLLAANSEDNKSPEYIGLEPGAVRLTTQQTLEFILKLGGRDRKIFTFSYNYDLTKSLMDLDNKALFLLFRPERRGRKGKKAMMGPWPVKWSSPDGQHYRLNLQGTKFTVSKGPHTVKDETEGFIPCVQCLGLPKKTVVVWDLFKFYQSKFVTALRDWKVGDEEMLTRMTRMKDKRAEFSKESPEAVRAYCLEECRYIAELAHKLVDAHEACGLELKNFYGAGSTGGAMLKAMGIKERLVPPPPEMEIPIACGFFGGRFENSVIGVINGPLLMVQGQDHERFYNAPIYDYDISSAYPYQLTALPCLLHGKWTLVKGNDARRMLEGASAALVRYSLEHNADVSSGSWGPFPFRTEEGSISFPACSGGGWIWKDEYLAGERYWPNVVFHEAWIYQTECECVPFSKIPYYYSQRVLIGKEGAGIILKLGPNSCYGKLAQSVGNAMFQSWIYAGLITSGCRAQMLDIYGMHEDPANLLIIATDGIKTRERLITPKPRDTGTWELMNEKGEHVYKPLGGWEEKMVRKGLFVARPGIYCPLDPTPEEIKEIRGRGVGKGVVLENHARILASWLEHGMTQAAQVGNVSRFCGGKTSISYQPSTKTYNRAFAEPGLCKLDKDDPMRRGISDLCRHGGICGNSKPSYGEWISRNVAMDFNPLPKRASVNPDGVTLKLREFPQSLTSVPYDEAVKSPEALEMAAAYLEQTENPDGDFMEYE